MILLTESDFNYAYWDLYHTDKAYAIIIRELEKRGADPILTPVGIYLENPFEYIIGVDELVVTAMLTDATFIGDTYVYNGTLTTINAPKATTKLHNAIKRTISILEGSGVFSVRDYKITTKPIGDVGEVVYEASVTMRVDYQCNSVDKVKCSKLVINQVDRTIKSMRH